MATIPIPKIVYGASTLDITYPPTQKSAIPDIQAERNDSFSISGLKQSVYWRSDELLSLQFENIPAADIPAWRSWRNFAVAGEFFNYYPDKTLAGFTTYTLEDKKLAFKFAYRGTFKTSFTLRRVIGADQTGS